MLVQQLKERIVKGSVYCTCKNHYQKSIFQPSEKAYCKNLSPSLTMVGPILNTIECLGYRRALDSHACTSFPYCL